MRCFHMTLHHTRSGKADSTDQRELARHARELATLTHDPRLRAELLRVADEVETDASHDGGAEA